MASKFTTTLGVNTTIPTMQSALTFERIIDGVTSTVNQEEVDETSVQFTVTEIETDAEMQSATNAIIKESGVYLISAMANLRPFTGVGTGSIEVRLYINDTEEATDGFAEAFNSPTEHTFKINTIKSLQEDDILRLSVRQNTQVPLEFDWVELNVIKL